MSESRSGSNQDRRRFIKIAVLGAASAPLFGGLVARSANAADLPPLTADNPTAAALGYAEDSTTVDAAKFPTHVAGQACAVCNLSAAAQGDGRLPCSLYPGTSVNPKGWCAAYVKKA
jgi:hypothetical protein